MFWIIRRVVLILALVAGFALGRAYERIVSPQACGGAGPVACASG
ncbi:hypothetical protein [Salipiger aestuarii]|nr:hypothetical protein [Salipiger aestuarii]